MDAIVAATKALSLEPEVKRNKKSTDLTVPGGSLYVMGPNLQSLTGATHEVLAATSSGARFAITLRCLGERQPGELKTDSLKLVKINETDGNWVGIQAYPRSNELLESQLALVGETGIYRYSPDATKVFGKTYENAGRSAMTIEINNNVDCTSAMKYKYGGKTVEGILTSTENLRRNQPEIAACFSYAREVLGVEFNWCHCVYYPTGEAKLGAHQDNEKQIAPNSVIAAFSVGADRKIRFMPK